MVLIMPKTTNESGYANISSTQQVSLSNIPANYARAKKKDFKLNNGEPVTTAIRKIIVQLLVIAIVPVIAILIFGGKYTSLNMLNNDDYGTLAINSQYQVVSENTKLTYVDSSYSFGFATMEMISSWAGESFTEYSLYMEYGKKDKASTIDSFVGILEEKLPDFEVNSSTQLGNYAFLDAIYQTMLKGDVAIVSMALSETLGDTENEEIVYVVIEEIDLGLSTITVMTPYGDTNTFSIDNFIERTRLSEYESSLVEKAGFALGFYATNTLITIEK